MKLVGKSYVVFGIGVVFVPLLISGTTYGPYDVYCDTALYKDTVFHFTVTNTAVNLYGYVHNYQMLGASKKVASIFFGLTNGYTGTTYDLVVDSIHVIVQKYTIPQPLQWTNFTEAKIKINGANVSNKQCHKYLLELVYPHTDNAQRTYCIRFTIFGSYE
ncbi:MAG: hypothetical protein ABIL40_00265 [candidate division WOR-3 bacterium]